MEGRLGAIYVGKRQVGGFLDWHVKLNLTDGTDGANATHKLQSWRVIAWAHWLFNLLEPGAKVRLKLCANAGKAYWEGIGRVSCQPARTVDTLVHARVEFIGSGELKAKEAPGER